MTDLDKYIEVSHFTGDGYKPLVDYGEWRVAVLRFIDELLPENIDCMDAHQETDEVFILVEGKCILFVGEPEDGGIKEIAAIPMEKNKLYNVKRGVYHTHTLSADAHVIIVENQDTTADNTLRLPLLLLAAWELLGLAWAVDLQLGLKRVGCDLILLALLGVFHTLGRRKRERSLFLILVLSTGFLVAAFSLYQRAGGTAGLERFYSDVQLRKGPGTFGNPNFLAHYLVGTTLLGFGWLLFGSSSAPPLARWMVAGATLTSLQALLLTQSRGAYLAIGLTSVLLLIRYAASSKRKTAAWVILLLVAALLLANLFWLPRSLVRQMDPQTPSNRFRLRTYSEALEMIAEGALHPEPLVTHRFAIENYREMIAVNLDKRIHEAMKTVVSFKS